MYYHPSINFMNSIELSILWVGYTEFYGFWGREKRKNNSFQENCNQNVTMFVDTIIVDRWFDVDKWGHHQSIFRSCSFYKSPPLPPPITTTKSYTNYYLLNGRPINNHLENGEFHHQLFMITIFSSSSNKQSSCSVKLYMYSLYVCVMVIWKSILLSAIKL